MTDWLDGVPWVSKLLSALTLNLAPRLTGVFLPCTEVPINTLCCNEAVHVRAAGLTSAATPGVMAED
jgi:hypothetical protein